MPRNLPGQSSPAQLHLLAPKINNGKETGNYYNGVILGLSRGNGKENRSYHLGFMFAVLSPVRMS